MKLFLESSVLLAASGSRAGASYHVFEIAPTRGWRLVSSPYCVAEVDKNVVKLGEDAVTIWQGHLRPLLAMFRDCVVSDRVLSFDAVKDKPVLITALAAECDVLLTLDRADFGTLFERGVYGMGVMTPGMFLMRHR